MRFGSFIKRIYLYHRNSNNNRDPRCWVFGEWFGNSVGDNSYYFANYLAENYNELELYWLCKGLCDTTPLNSKIKVLDFSSREAVEISRKSSVVIMNQGISDLNNSVINYWGNAVKVNLWHGVPWKKIGFDSEIVNPLVKAFRSILYKYDFFETPSEEYSAHISSAFNIKEESLIKAGFPRNSLFYDLSAVNQCKQDLIDRLKLPSNAIIISYLPTFRDNQTKLFSFSNIKDDSFTRWLVSNNIYLIQKAHAADVNSFSEDSEHIINLTDISAQKLMAASDMLITDYSSCFFDYLLLDRPIIHYLYDYDYYKNTDRGLYYDKDEVICGSAPENEDELIQAIIDNLYNPNQFKELRLNRKSKFMTYESPDSCKIIAQRIFEELKEKGMPVK